MSDVTAQEIIDCDRVLLKERTKKMNEAIAESRRLRTALERWRCEPCCGTGRVLVYADGDRERYDVCSTCKGDKLNPIARAALHPPREAPETPPAICTHPSFDVDGVCHTCGDKVALAFPVEFAKRMAEIHAASPEKGTGASLPRDHYIREALEEAGTEVPRGHCDRCDRCGWEYDRQGRACRPGDCSMRPLPPLRLTCAGCGRPLTPPEQPTCGTCGGSRQVAKWEGWVGKVVPCPDCGPPTETR